MIVLTGDHESILGDIVARVRNYRGLRRKSPIGLTLPMFRFRRENVIAAKGEDAAIIRSGDRMLAFAADGIMHELVNINPRWAGYCSVLVNINDILAMNGYPLAAVNVISFKDAKIIEDLIKGVCDACSKFDVPMVGGHLHPDADCESIAVAMLGEIRGKKPLLSDSSRPGDRIVAICDCKGRFTPKIPYSWDCTSEKSRATIKKNIEHLLSAMPFLTAGKDISNPGILGTLAMLLEASGVGATVDIERIPVPKGVDLLQWITAYQGFGFIGTIRSKDINRVRDALEGTCVSVSVIGNITADRKFNIRIGESQRLLFDMSREKITGLF
ncbi:MAG: AIR synthase related protein [Thermoplasmata archaeon]